MAKYHIILKKSNESLGTYVLGERMFNGIQNLLEPFKSNRMVTKPIKCVETGVVYESASGAAKWIHEP